VSEALFHAIDSISITLSCGKDLVSFLMHIINIFFNLVIFVMCNQLSSFIYLFYYYYFIFLMDLEYKKPHK